MFGLGSAEIELKINKTSFSPGDTIEGTVTLKVLKPTKSNGVVFLCTPNNNFFIKVVVGIQPIPHQSA
jgi:hypothetical protein